jgi:Zn-finger nucleic acid-binding protein
MVRCPTCSIVLRQERFEDLAFEVCLKCRGIWMDPNEIIEKAAHIRYDPDAIAPGRSLLSSAGETKEDAIRFFSWMKIAFSILQELIF